MTRKNKGIDWINEVCYDLESANYHSITHVPDALYAKLKEIVPIKLHLELGRIIYDCFQNV